MTYKLLSSIISLLFFYNVNAQNTFSKYVDLKVGLADNPRDFIIINDLVFISSVQVCEQSTIDRSAQFCTSLTMFNLKGEMLDSLIIRDATVGNEKVMLNTSPNNISMIAAPSDANQFDKSPPRIIKVSFEKNELTLDTIISLKFENNLIDLNLNEGFLMKDNKYISYGTGLINDEPYVCGFIHKWDSQTLDHIETKIIKSGDAENQVFDLQVNSEGNLVYVNRIENLSNLSRQQFLVTELNDDNNIESEYASEEFRNNSTRPNLTILKNEDYIINTSNKDIRGSEDMVCIDHINLEEKWRTPILEPFTDPTEVIDVLSVSVLKSNEIICIGQRRVADENGLPISGFMYKLSENGEVLWKRTYKKFDSEGEYILSQLTKIIELDDGSLFLIGNARDFDDTGQLKRMLWILKTDSFGCIDENCDESILLSSEREELDNISVVPNPFNNYIQIKTVSKISRVKLFDIMGNEVFSAEAFVDNDIHLDLPNLVSGFYYLAAYNQRKMVGLEKIFKAF